MLCIWHIIDLLGTVLIIIIICHDFIPPSKRDSNIKSDYAGTIVIIYPLAYTPATWKLYIVMCENEILLNLPGPSHDFTLTHIHCEISSFFILYQTHSPMCTTTCLSQPLVLYHQQLKSDLYQTSCHSYTVVLVLFQAPYSPLIPHYPCTRKATTKISYHPASIQHYSLSSTSTMTHVVLST